jgi:hypothetical protein
MPSMTKLIRDIWQGKTMLRSLMNTRVHDFEIGGTVVDIGGGNKPEYQPFFKRSGPVNFTVVDLKESAGKRLDLEIDRLPLPRGYIKLLAQKLNCHVNSIRKGWERLDPVWVKHINDFSKQIKKERTQALIDAGFPANYAKKLVKKGL